ASAARGALRRAAQRAYQLHALDAAASYAQRAQSLFTPELLAGEPAGAAELEREQLCLHLLLAEIDFYRDQAAFLADGGLERLADLADRLAGAGADADAARAWTLLGQAAWLRGVRPAALSYLERAVALFEQLPD